MRDTSAQILRERERPEMMESCTILPSLPSIFPPKPHCSRNRRNTVHPLRQWNTRSTSTALQCHKMVWGSLPGSQSSKTSSRFLHLRGYVAIRIVTAQLESYNPEAYGDLMSFMENHSLNDGDKFIADMMRESSHHKTLALRILEVRSAYCKTDFEWDNLKRLASKMVEDRNTKVMRDYLSETSPVENGSEK